MEERATESVLNRIVELTSAKRSGDGWLGRCPAHDDKKASLSIALKEGKILLHCFASCGCTFERIRDSLPEDIREGLSGRATKLKVVTGRTKRNIIATYKYTDEHGATLYEILRYDIGEQKCGVRREVSGKFVYDAKGVRRVLFELPRLRAASKGQWVFICEGEKDATTLNDLGFIATTNPFGAKNWKDDDGIRFGKEFVGRDVVICEDNDDAGRERTGLILPTLAGAKSIRAIGFEKMPPGSDVSDFLSPLKSSPETAKETWTTYVLENARELEVPKTAPVSEGKKTASRNEYIELTKKHITEFRRDILSDTFYGKHKDEWIPAKGILPIVRSEMRAFGKYFFPLSALDDHLEWYASTIEPSLLIDIPAWDKTDRVAQICEHLEFENVDAQVFYEAILHWGAQMFRRIKDPSIQPILPIIHGGQGAGKDALIQTLVGELGDYFMNLDIRSGNTTETERQLPRAICFNISEFDRVARIESSTLKYLLNTPFTSVRDPYEYAVKKRPVRASFIASCNTKDVLLDSTGARRYWFFAVKTCGFEMQQSGENLWCGTGKLNTFTKGKGGYPGMFIRKNFRAERMQILSQFQYLAESGWSPTSKALEIATATVNPLVPESIDDQIVSEFKDMLEELAKEKENVVRSSKGKRFVPNMYCTPIIDKISKSFNTTGWRVRRSLSIAGLRTHDGSTRGFFLTDSPSEKGPAEEYEEP